MLRLLQVRLVHHENAPLGESEELSRLLEAIFCESSSARHG